MNNLALIVKAAAEGKSEIDYTVKCKNCKFAGDCALQGGGEHLCTVSEDEKRR